MKITVFAKKRQTKDGKKTFFTYFTKLTKNDGEVVTASVRFVDGECEIPATFPCNLIIDKGLCNLATKTETAEDGKEYTNKTLWVKGYEMGEPYVDTSLDDFEQLTI